MVDRVQTDHHRHVARLRIAVQLAHDVVRELRIERRDRLVSQDQVGPLIQNASDADALQLAAGEPVATIEQSLSKIEPHQRGARAGDVEGIGKRGERFPQRPGAETSGENGGYDALARRQRRRLVNRADTRPQSSKSGARQLPRIAIRNRQDTPDVGRTAVPMTRSKLVLPAPDGPMIATRSPSLTARLTRSSAR